MDAASVGEGPYTLEAAVQAGTLVERHTTGYLVAETPEKVVVAQSFDPDDATVDEVTVIPAPWVRTRRRGKRRK